MLLADRINIPMISLFALEQTTQPRNYPVKSSKNKHPSTFSSISHQNIPMYIPM